MEVPFFVECSKKGVDQVLEMRKLGNRNGSTAGIKYAGVVDTYGRRGRPGTVESVIYASGCAQVCFWIILIYLLLRFM